MTQPLEGIRCVACHQVMKSAFQPGFGSREGFILLTCANPRCPMRGFTFSQANYPPKKLAEYLETGARRLASAGFVSPSFGAS